jgi:heme d1 biosynthesis radical SAM protein NirJ
MLRLTQLMRELLAPTPPGPRRHPPGPVVIWNLVRRCNLACKHCYAISADVDFPGELNTGEVFAVMDDLARFRVPALVLSGGEPLLRPDLFDITRRAKETGFFVALSTNGTLIDEGNVGRIRDAGYDYVGVSLDGRRETHDRFRRRAGAHDRSVTALRLCRDAGIKVGVRFTLTQDNAQDFEWLLDFADAERIDKFYLSHLNYAGRGNVNRRTDAWHATTRAAMERLIERCWQHLQAGSDKEYVTGNNDADGVFLLHWVARRFPDRAAHLRAKLAQWGGNASGVDVANIDNLGEVHPDTYWWNWSLGNVRKRPFSEIWTDLSDPLMAGLKAAPRKVGGRCGECAYFDICGGNTRVRAWQLTGDPWAEDPACYLDDDELGIAPGRERLAVTPYSRQQRTSDAPV